jgi:hypothetical protein
MKSLFAMAAVICASSFSFAADNIMVGKSIEEINKTRTQIVKLYTSLPPEARGPAFGLLAIEQRLAQVEKNLNAAILGAKVNVPNYGGQQPNYGGGVYTPNKPYVPTIENESTSTYCAATCLDLNGNPQAQYTRGASADFEVKAKEKALEALRSSFTCNFGSKVTECAQESKVEKFYCSAGCTDLNGNVNNSFLAGASGNSMIEAMTDAATKVSSSYTCNFGVKTNGCTDVVKKNYCVATCADLNGKAQMNFAKGAEGKNKIEAQVNAIAAVKSSFTCNFGIVISECSDH